LSSPSEHMLRKPNGARRCARCMSARRGHGEDSIYFDEAKQRYIGAVFLGWSADGRHKDPRP
jgi:hypothetical protein